VSELTKKLEVAANVAIILAALLVGTVAVKNYLLPTRPSYEIAAGTKISLPSVDWSHGKTLLLVLSRDCPYCTQSAPFYRRLVRETKGQPGLQLVAVLPQSPKQATTYLSGLKVPLTNIRQAAIPDLGVRGTPTLILVDNKGSVIRSWVGKLPTDKEDDVLGSLRS
jgi:hypothetical protein